MNISWVLDEPLIPLLEIVLEFQNITARMFFPILKKPIFRSENIGFTLVNSKITLRLILPLGLHRRRLEGSKGEA